jgi:hypothetical protein
MKTRDIVLVGGGILLIYLLMRKRKSVVTSSDLTNTGAPAPAPALPKPAATISGAVISKGTIVPTSPDVVPNKKPFPVVVEDIRVPIKEPITVPTTNLIPNIYDRGVGMPMAASGERYYNMSGYCSENVQNACRCSVKDDSNYKLDIPKLP